MIAAIALAAAVAGCAPRMPAPVEDRSGPRSEQPRPPPPRERPAVGMPAPDGYRVARGDTLYSIAFRYGLDWRDLAAWNRIGPPYTIFPGDRLRLSAPPGSAPAVATPSPRPAPPAGTDPRPVPQPAPRPEPRPLPAPEPAPEPQRPEPAEPARVPAPVIPGPTRSVAGVAWRWPTEGAVARRFDASDTRKGIHISGSEGQSVVAAADGQVVYSGTGLIGYGELIIVKHSDSILSAYGHNRRRLVAEGERVRAGQQIAELGRNERDAEILHFEIRRNGQPVNPLEFLPPR